MANPNATEAPQEPTYERIRLSDVGDRHSPVLTSRHLPSDGMEADMVTPPLVWVIAIWRQGAAVSAGIQSGSSRFGPRMGHGRHGGV